MPHKIRQNLKLDLEFDTVEPRQEHDKTSDPPPPFSFAREVGLAAGVGAHGPGIFMWGHWAPTGPSSQPEKMGAYNLEQI